jgi:histidinol phosphatase-like enzyme
MGLPAAGKSTVARSFAASGHTRLNRDEAGGSLADLLPALEPLVAAGGTRFVLDNTYLSRASRARVIDAASRLGLPVRCVWLTTGVEDAQINAVQRMLSRHGRLLEPHEIKKVGRTDPSVFAPMAQYRCERELEPPEPAEGFTRVDMLPFERRRASSFSNRAVIVWCDGVLWRSRSGGRTPADAEDVEAMESRGEVLRRFAADGWRLLGLSWQPEIAAETRTRPQVEASVARLRERLGARIEVAYCAHPAGPPTCWCRKPLPGLVVAFIQRYELDPARCVYVGAGSQDPRFARALGLPYREADEFFA